MGSPSPTENRPSPETRPSRDSVAGPTIRRLSTAKKVAFSAITCVVVLGGLELVLAAFGVRRQFYRDDPFVGFASYAPLFVPETDAHGTTRMVTAGNKLRRFNPQRFSRVKQPGVARIFCVGGSTTYGRPYDDKTSYCGWLREFLPVADEGKTWEIVNAGGVSYASYRIAALMEELIEYKPDLFVVYCGHNEFLEHRTYEAVIEAPPALRDAGGLLSRTRIWTAMTRLRSAFTSSGNETPATKQMLPDEVAEVLNLTQGPETYRRDDQLRAGIVGHYRYNLERMIEIARSAGAKVLLVTPAANLKDCLPFKSERAAAFDETDTQTLEALSVQLLDAEEQESLDEQLSALDRLLARDDRHAQTHFLRGRVLLGLGRDREAKTAFERARDEDVCPLRAVREILQIVRDVATDSDVALVDFARLAEDQADDGIPGEESFLDHVHPTIEMHRLLALALIEELIAQRFVRPGPSWTEQSILHVTDSVMGRIDQQAHGAALYKLSKCWAGLASTPNPGVWRNEPPNSSLTTLWFITAWGPAQRPKRSTTRRSSITSGRLNFNLDSPRHMLGWECSTSFRVNWSRPSGTHNGRSN